MILQSNFVISFVGQCMDNRAQRKGMEMHSCAVRMRVTCGWRYMYINETACCYSYGTAVKSELRWWPYYVTVYSQTGTITPFWSRSGYCCRQQTIVDIWFSWERGSTVDRSHEYNVKTQNTTLCVYYPTFTLIALPTLSEYLGFFCISTYFSHQLYVTSRMLWEPFRVSCRSNH